MSSAAAAVYCFISLDSYFKSFYHDPLDMDLLLLNAYPNTRPQGNEMAMSSTMPGHNDISDELYFTPGGEPPLQVPTMRSHPSSRNSREELFFDIPAPSQDSQIGQYDESSMPSYLIFEPVVSSVSDTETTDWRRYEPPTELLDAQAGSSREVRDVLVSSVERLRARHTEEEERRAARARQERPLGRVGRVSVKPRLEIPSSADQNPPHANRSPRLSGGGALSASSNDSGYASENGSKSAHRGAFGLSALFTRHQRLAADIDSLQESYNQVESDIHMTSQDSVSTTESLSVASLSGECVSCLDDFATVELIKLSCHSYCGGCFQRLISTALESETQWPAKCCLNTIPSASILPHINSQMKRKYKQREDEWSIPIGDRIYCAQSACSAWIPPKHIKKEANTARCHKCSHKLCVICRGPAHGSGDCPQDVNIQATIDLAALEGWKRCYSCQALVEHNKGCRHMTCRCKAQFCYICGLKWQTCACTDTQLAAIQQRAEDRRQETTVRTARELAEAEEIRVAIQMVEEFERAEAARLALEAEVERRREEEARRRREEERIGAVSRHFHQLTVELDLLHDIQKVRMAERYEFEVGLQSKDRQDALDTLSIRHPAEIQLLETESRIKISDSEYKFDQEYQTRLAEERRIEDDYVDKLRAYWSGKPEAEYRVRDARDELRRDQDKEYRFWDAHRRRELQAIVEGENRKMEALRVKHMSEIKAVDGRAKIDELEWKKTKWAEGKWAEEVIRERVTMFQEMEQEEYARGA